MGEEDTLEFSRDIDRWINEVCQKYNLTGVTYSFNNRFLSKMADVNIHTKHIRISTKLWPRNNEKRQTIFHEVAHIIAKDGHGPKWKNTMIDLGLPPLRCHDIMPMNMREGICDCYPHRWLNKRLAAWAECGRLSCPVCGEWIIPI